MEPSEEIRRVVHRWLVAARDGDADGYAARISEHPGMLGIGTDDEEWFHAADIPVWRRQVEETGGFPIAWDEIEAWEEGTVGWAASKMTIRPISGSGAHSLLRGSYILHLERGEWKIVQAHWSLGIPNVDVLGVELPTSLDQIEQAIQQERPDLSETTASDGTVTLVFTDIVDSTVLTARLGDRAWMETVRRHHEVIRETVESHGGRVVETQGDGSLLAFASARRAVSCAKDIQAAISLAFADASPPIRVRIGIHTGDVLQEADRFFGTTVNYAARVASHALGGEVIVSSLVHDLVGDSGVTFLESRDVELKGLEGTHRLFAVAVA
ncbi:MAG: adenylate/guanylate cyclase domain-containing protein [Candidatus Limnocylindria bacterium]